MAQFGHGPNEASQELLGNLEALQQRSEARSQVLEKPDVAETGLRQLAAALEQKR